MRILTSIALSVLFVLLLATVLSATPPAPVRATVAPVSYDCEGDACSQVTLTWDQERQQFRADNSSSRQVKVQVETFAGSSYIHIPAQQSGYLEVKTFNGPYHASFE